MQLLPVALDKEGPSRSRVDCLRGLQFNPLAAKRLNSPFGGVPLHGHLLSEVVKT